MSAIHALWEEYQLYQVHSWRHLVAFGGLNFLRWSIQFKMIALKSVLAFVIFLCDIIENIGLLIMSDNDAVVWHYQSSLLQIFRLQINPVVYIVVIALQTFFFSFSFVKATLVRQRGDILFLIINPSNKTDRLN